MKDPGLLNAAFGFNISSHLPCHWELSWGHGGDKLTKDASLKFDCSSREGPGPLIVLYTEMIL